MPAPFTEPDYTDPRTPDMVAADRPKVELQVSGLRRLAADPEFTQAFVERLQQRRSGSAAVPIEIIRRADGQMMYVAGGQALVPREQAGGAAGLAERSGLRVVDVDPTGPVVLVEPGAGRNGRSARDIVEELRRQVGGSRSADATTGTTPLPDYNYLVPLGGIVMKAEGGPENSDGSRPFGQVSYPSTGPAPLVAVVDTGVSLERRTDGYLQGLVQPDNVDALDALPFPVPDQLLDAAAGHGAFVTGVVQQVAPTAQLRVYRVTGPDGLCSDLQLAVAIRRAAAEGAKIINLSLGTSTIDDTAPPAMTAAIKDVLAADDDLLIVVAAGNDGDNGVPMWPAALSATGPGPQRFDRVVAVAGLDPQGQPSTFSSRGDWITVSTIGQGVLSTYVIGTENGALINDCDPDTFGPNAWAVWTGSSFAAPQVTGAVARRCEEFGEPPPEALKRLVNGIPRTPPWGHRMTILPGT